MRRSVPLPGRLHRSVLRALAPVLVFAMIGLSPAPADTVVRRDGSKVEGRVLAVDGDHVMLEIDSRNTRILRAEVASIHFAESEAVSPLKVELRNVRSDDAVDVYLGDELVLAEAREKGEWIDLTPRLKTGNNPLRLRIHNDRGIWAYKLNLRINGTVTTLSCGTPLDLNAPCRCCGKHGRERGVIDDLPLVWLYVDLRSGTAEVLP